MRFRPKSSDRDTPLMRSGVVWASLAVVLFATGCDSGPSEAETMQTEIAPYLDEVARYDRWARRLSLAGAAFRSEAALEEAAFAPLRDRSRVRAAWLDRQGPDARSLSYPEHAPVPPTAGWVTVQTRDLGEVEAQHGVLELGEEPVRVTFIRRTRPASGGAVLQVSMALAGPDAEDPDDP
ncbi:MAG: hypothetical protein AB8I08_26980 [Sandaracinaceae bacterium]